MAILRSPFRFSSLSSTLPRAARCSSPVMRLLGFDFAPVNCIQRFPDVARRVVEIRFDRDFGIVNERAVERNVRAGRAAAKEIDRAAAADHAHGLLPGFLRSDGFDDNICTAPAVGDFAHLLDDIGLSGVNPRKSAPINSAIASCVLRLPNAITRAPMALRACTNISPIGPYPDYDDRVSLFDLRSIPRRAGRRRAVRPEPLRES